MSERTARLKGAIKDVVRITGWYIAEAASSASAAFGASLTTEQHEGVLSSKRAAKIEVAARRVLRKAEREIAKERSK